MLAVMKTLANLNASERRKKQEGKFGAKYKDHSFVCPITSQGVPTGERVIVQLLGGVSTLRSSITTDLGMRPKLAEQWVGLHGQRQGPARSSRPCPKAASRRSPTSRSWKPIGCCATSWPSKK